MTLTKQLEEKETDMGIEYLLGNGTVLAGMAECPGMEPFSEKILDFCEAVSKRLMAAPGEKSYPDAVSLGFWLRKGSAETLKKRFCVQDGNMHLARGVVFHVTPSNVPVNFAYSLFAGLLCGNANIVRVPSKNFPQVSVIISAIKEALESYPCMAPYICLLRYGHEKEISSYLSSLCDVRMVWGGDAAVNEIRKIPVSPRASEVVFADRFSLAVIETAVYRALGGQEKARLARAFYNDTYFTDQNACTSPRAVIWICSPEEGSGDAAQIRREFWSGLWKIAGKEYAFQDIQGVDKLVKKYLLAADGETGVRKSPLPEGADNRLVCMEIDRLPDKLADYFGNAGFFLEFVTGNIMDLSVICSDRRCQTIGYMGRKETILPLAESGLKGIDRIVPIGKTMDFDFIWDGYNLVERLTRTVKIF